MKETVGLSALLFEAHAPVKEYHGMLLAYSGERASYGVYCDGDEFFVRRHHVRSGNKPHQLVTIPKAETTAFKMALGELLTHLLRSPLKHRMVTRVGKAFAEDYQQTVGTMLRTEVQLPKGNMLRHELLPWE